MKTSAGLVLEDRYRLVSLIATGGMGEVWKGWDQDLDRDVAVKVLREEYAHDEGFLKRFRAEARHTAALSHDTIAGLYDYGELDGRAYIVMELCAGRPLSEIIEENPAGLPEARVVSLLISLARALDAAHAKGVVHRDVKPENILVDDANGWIMKITDFGIARSQDQARLTKTGLVMGTAQYLSPEQAMGKQATSLSDIYALGIVAYEMLTGRRPFTGASQVDIAMAQVKKQPPALPESISPDLRQLVMMTLAKAPANRPRSAAAVARILEAIQRGEEPHFATGAVPVTSQGPSGGALAGPGEGMQSVGSSSAAAQREGSRPAAPGGARTAAMPLPLAAKRRGVRHRSGPSAYSSSSARSASSALSASSANPGLHPEDFSANPVFSPGSPNTAPPLRPPADRPASSGAQEPTGSSPSARTVRGTSTGARVGPFSLPGLALVLILAILAIVLVLGLAGAIPMPWASSALAPLPDPAAPAIAAGPLPCLRTAIL